MNGRVSITEAAQQLGVSAKTIMRWEKAGKIQRAKRDWRGWRVYSADDLQDIKHLVETVY